MVTTTTTEHATVCGGCFWGMEKWYKKEFPSIVTTVGYIGGAKDEAVYETVKTGKTGHYEALRVDFDPSKVTYRQIIEYFFRIHFPCQEDGQGEDVGPQYRSAIFTHSDEQAKIAYEVIKEMNEKRWDGKIVTKVIRADVDSFNVAEKYHQDYLTNNPAGWCIHKPQW